MTNPADRWGVESKDAERATRHHLEDARRSVMRASRYAERIPAIHMRLMQLADSIDSITDDLRTGKWRRPDLDDLDLARIRRQEIYDQAADEANEARYEDASQPRHLRPL